MQNKQIINIIENLKGRKNYEEKKAFKLGFSSLYNYFEYKILKEKKIIEDKKKKSEVIKTENAKSPTGKESQKMKAPDFLLADLDGNVMSFSAYEGQVVLLTFWGTWCGPCRQEIPDFIKLYDEFNNEGLEIVGIAIQSGGAESIKKFSDYYKINYPVLTDIEGNESYKAFSDFGTISGVGTRAVPTTFLIDRAGYIVKTYRGARPGHVFSKDFKPYL